jgi:hypothetical protein
MAQKEVRDEISMRKRRISEFRGCGSDPRIWPLGALLSKVDKFWEFIYGIVGRCFSLITP